MVDQHFSEARSSLLFELDEVMENFTRLRHRHPDDMPILVVTSSDLEKTRPMWLTYVSDADHVAYGMSYVSTGLLENSECALLTLQVRPCDGMVLDLSTVTRAGVSYVVSYPLLFDPALTKLLPMAVAKLCGMPPGACIGIPVVVTSTPTSEPGISIPLLVLKE